jgi:hypothetical protein
MKSRKPSVALVAAGAFAALILSACTLSLDPINTLNDAFRFADTNVGTLKIVNSAKNGAVLYGIQIIQPDKSMNEYRFDGGLLPGNSREYVFPAQINYSVKFNNGKGWTKTPSLVYFVKDQTVIVAFTGTEEISIDLSGVKGKLTVYNLIPTTEGEYVIENLRVSAVENATNRENVTFYFYTPNGIRNGEKPDFDILPGDYWVRAQIRNPKTGKLSKWSIPAHVGNYSTTEKDQFDISTAPSKVTVSASRGGIAIFDERVLKGGQAGGEVDTGYDQDKNPDGNTNFPSIPDNNLLNENGEETSNVDGKVDPDSKPVKAIKVEKLGFPTADKDGVTVPPTYTYAQKDIVLQEGKVVKTTIHDQAVSGGGTWKLSLSESGWYLISFSIDGKAFSKGFPIRLEDKNKDGDFNDPDEVEPGVIPPFHDNNSTWTDKQGVVIRNDTPAEGGKITYPDGSYGGELSPADAQKPITDIKVYNLDGSLRGHYQNRYGLPIYNAKEWIVTPALPPGDYLVTLSDDNGASWTDPPFPLHVDGNGNGGLNYDKTHPFWKGTTTGKPAPELTSPADPIWNDDDANWDPKIEIRPSNPIYVVVPSQPPLDRVPAGAGPKELEDLAARPEDTESAQGSQLDIIHLKTSDLGKINFIKLNSFGTPDKAYRIIDLRRITYTDANGQPTQGGIPQGKRLSLVGFDLKPDLYYVYLSENGHVWWKHKIAVKISAPWTTNAKGEVVPISAKDVGKVIYKDIDDNWDRPNDTSPPNTDNGGGNDNGGNSNNGDGNDGGGLYIPKKGFLVIQNLLPVNITSLTIRRPYTDGDYFVDGNVTFNEHPVTIASNRFEVFHIPVTEGSPYQVKVTAVGSLTSIYKVTIEEGKFTYVLVEGPKPDGSGSSNNPIVVGPGDGLPNVPGAGNGGNGDNGGNGGNAVLPGIPESGGTGTSPPPDDNDDITVVVDDGTSGDLMQPGIDPVGYIPDYAEGGYLFDRNYPSMAARLYPSGQVQPYLPNPSVSVSFPQGGDGTKQNMDGRGYFNFRFFWTGDSDWGIGYLAIQRLQRRGTSTAKDPVGPMIVLLDAKAATYAEMQNGEGQRSLGNIYNGNGIGSIKGEDRSFNEWQTNWLGLRDSVTGWQLNVGPDGTLDPTQPVYRSGKGHYPTDRDATWRTDRSDRKANRENGAHRALNNPGRLYTTGVTVQGLYAPLGAGFEAGEYRVYLYKGYDSLYANSDNSNHNGTSRQKKMYRYYEADFDITIYPGVVTTAIYRAGLEKFEGAFAYTPIPQAAFGKLVVLNNPPNNDYTVNAILLDKPGYQKGVNTTSVYEVHRYIAAIASTPSSMVGGTPNALNGNNWGKMNPLRKGEMHTFILPPGGYRIAVQSTRDRDKRRAWYGESANEWLPVVIMEGETVYLTYRGDELSR